MAATVQQREYIRQDGKEKVTGAGRYTADLTLAGQLHAGFRYSDHTRARVLRIDASRARALPGVFAVLTHEDVPDVLYGQLVKDRRLFAKEEVRFEADIVAAVAALTPELAKQAVELIEVEYEPLPPITDPEAALAPDAPLVHADWASYEAEEALGLNGNVLGYSTIVKGDADAAMAAADVVVKGRYLADGSHGVPIEPRAILAQWHGDRVTIWSSSQTPYPARSGRRALSPDPRVQRAGDRAVARRRLRLEVRLPLRGARCGARAGGRTPGQAGVLTRGGVHRPRPPP